LPELPEQDRIAKKKSPLPDLGRSEKGRAWTGNAKSNTVKRSGKGNGGGRFQSRNNDGRLLFARRINAYKTVRGQGIAGKREKSGSAANKEFSENFGPRTGHKKVKTKKRSPEVDSGGKKSKANEKTKEVL